MVRHRVANFVGWGAAALVVGFCIVATRATPADQRNRWDFLVTASPVAVPGATGSPLNPIATF